MGGVMSTLKSAAEWWDGFNHDQPPRHPWWLTEAIAVRDDEVRQVCADAADEWSRSDACSPILREAILNAGKTDDSRERLGRALWNAQYPNGSWRHVPEMVKEQFRSRAVAVLDEQRKIEEEA